MFTTGIYFSKIAHILFDERLDYFIKMIQTSGFTVFLRNQFLYPWKSGQVFYGGILGGLLTCFILSYFLFGRDWKKVIMVFDVAVFTIFMMSALGRLGCYLQGCCFGIPSNSWGVIFPARSAAAFELAKKGLISSAWDYTIPVIPTQLLHFFTSFCIFLFLLHQLRKAEKLYAGYFFFWGMLLHAIATFSIEFIRFDNRGHFLFFSTSQWIAIMVASTLLILRYKGVFRKY